MSEHLLSPKYLGDGVYIHDEKYRIVLAVNDHNNKVVYMENEQILGLVRFAIESGLISKENI
jgi:Holliday junction resolvase